MNFRRKLVEQPAVPAPLRPTPRVEHTSVPTTVTDASTTQVMLKEMEELLRVVATSGSPSRPLAVRYTHCRDALLAGEVRSAVPGFVVQCVSIYKFHDFINLYDADGEARVAFIENAFSRGKVFLSSKRSKDVFRDFDF